MAKLTEKEYQDLINKTTENFLKEKGLTEMVRKLQFHDKPVDEMDKYEKTMRFFQAKMDNNRAEVAKYCGGTIKDLSGGVAGSGLELLPTEFHTDIIDRVKADPRALRNMCTVVPVTFRNGTWPVGATGISLNWESSDTNPITATTPTFASLPYSVNRIDGYTAIARDLLADTPVNLYDYLTKQYAKAFVKAENLAIMTGTGTNQPKGIVNSGVISVPCAAAATTNVLTCDDLMQLPFSVDVTWRDGGAYYVNTSIVRQMKLFKDTLNRYLWVDGDITKGIAPTFNGYPVYEFTAIFPSNLVVNSKTTCTEALFGNLEYYYLFDKNEMGSEINTQSDTAFKNHEALVKMWERIDGQLSIPSAFALLTGFLA